GRVVSQRRARVNAKGDRPDRFPDDAALRAIVQGVEAETGERFFASLVQHLASALGVQYAFVSELLADRPHFRTRAVWGRGRLLDNFEIPVAGTPCEAVLGGQVSHHSQHLCELFPADARLREWGVGRPRRGPAGTPCAPDRRRLRATASHASATPTRRRPSPTSPWGRTGVSAGPTT